MMAETYTVNEAARLAGASPPSIRRYAKRFADNLSAGANPGKNLDRSFTGHDVQLFAYIAAQRDLGTPYESIGERISNAKIEAKLFSLDELQQRAEGADQLDNVISADTDTQAAEMAAMIGLGSIARNLAELTERAVDVAELRDELKALTERVEALERQLAAMPTTIIGWGRRKE